MLIEKSVSRRHKKKNQYTIKEGWIDSTLDFDKRDFYQNYSELIVSQLFSSFFNHDYKSKRSVSQILRSGGLYQDRIMEEKPNIENVSLLEYKFNSAFLCLKKSDVSRPILEHKTFAQRCHMISQSQYQKDFLKILKQDKFLSKNIIERMMLMLWITEKSCVLSYSNTKPKELLRNENIDTNYYIDNKEELCNDIDLNFDIYYKKYDKSLKENSIYKMTASDFINVRNSIREMYEDLKDPFVNIKAFFDKYQEEFDIISQSFDNHMRNFEEFKNVSAYIKTSSKNVFEEIKNYTNIL